MDKFPKMLFRQPGIEPMHGDNFSTTAVNDEDELSAALADGWHESTPEAQAAYKASKAGSVSSDSAPTGAAKLASAGATSSTEQQDEGDADDTKPPTRAELEAKATELGIEFSPKLGDKKLAERIAAKLASTGA